MAPKADMFSLWPFTEEVCRLCYSEKKECPTAGEGIELGFLFHGKSPAPFWVFLLFCCLVQPAPTAPAMAQKSQAVNNAKAFIIGFGC